MTSTCKPRNIAAHSHFANNIVDAAQAECTHHTYDMLSILGQGNVRAPLLTLVNRLGKKPKEEVERDLLDAVAVLNLLNHCLRNYSVGNMVLSDDQLADLNAFHLRRMENYFDKKA